MNLAILLADNLQASAGISGNDIPLKPYWILSNLCYIPCVSIFKVILHYRIVRSEVIVGRLFCTIGLHMVLFLSALSLIRIDEGFSSVYIACFYGAFAPLLFAWRLLLRHFLKVCRMRGRNICKVVLVGNGDNMVELDAVMKDVMYGYKVEGIFFRGEAEILSPAGKSYEAELARLKAWLPRHTVQELYCGLPSVCHKDVLALIRYCENNMIRFYSVPNVCNYGKQRLQLNVLGEVPVLSIRREPLRRPMNRLVKRSFDLVCSALFLVTLFSCIILC